MKSARPLLTVLVFLFTTACFGQQSFMDEPGIPRFTTAFPVEHGFINLANGNLHIEIPIATYPQRGSLKPIRVRLVYDSRLWSVGTEIINGGQFWQRSSAGGLYVGGEFRLVTEGEAGRSTFSQSTQQCGSLVDAGGKQHPQYRTTYENYTYQEPNGTNHRMNIDRLYRSSPYCTNGNQVPTGSGYDANGYKMVVDDNNITVYEPNGTRVTPLLTSTSATVSPGTSMVQDTNGNYFTYANGSAPNTTNVVDSLGRIPVLTSFSNNQTFIDYLCEQGCNLSGGDRARITLNIVYIPIATQFNAIYQGSGVREASGSSDVLDSIVLPDGTSYHFQYDSYGEMTGITPPTGGQVTYGYANFTDYTGYTNRWVTSRTVDGNVWNFPPTLPSCSTPPCPLVVTMTTPPYNDGTTTASDNYVYTYAVSNGTESGAWINQEQYFRGSASGTPVLTKTTDYGYAGACPAFSGFVGQGLEKIRETITWPTASGTLSKKAEYCYDNFHNLTTSKMWDYQPNGNFAAAPDREVDNIYRTDPTTDAAYTNANILNLLKTTTTKDAGGNQVSQTTYGYDETGLQPSGVTTNLATPTAPRANRTSVSRWLNTSTSPVVSNTTWYDSGEVYQSIDPLGHTTTTYFDSTGAYPNKICNTLGQCSYPVHDFNTGLMNSFTDMNGSQAGDPAYTTNYTFDGLLRPLCTNLPDGGQTCLAYPDANHVSRTQIITASLPPDLFTTIFDGLGRTIHTQHTLPAGISTVDTHYDPVGIPDTVTNPYFTTSDPTYGITQTFHDALGRSVKTIKQDGSVVVIKHEDTPADTSTVSLLCTTVTDESGNPRQSCSNGFGELAKVVEPNQSSVATNATGSVTISGSEQGTNVGLSITVAGSGFETPVLGSGANAYQYHPTGSSWTFGPNSGTDSNNNIVGGSGITGNNSGFTSSNPAAPEGAQVAFLQGGPANYISQSLSGFQAGVNYTVSFQAAQRGNFNTGGQDFDVYLDSTLLATFRPAGTSYALLSTPYFTTTAGTHTLKFVGRDSAGGNGNAAFIDAVQVTGSVVIPNSGFEIPALGTGNFQYSPTGGSWTFGGGTGISANSSDFTSGNPGAPEGSQVAFIQFGSDDVFSQSLSGFQTGVNYTVSFSAAQRGNSSNGGQDFDVYLDSTLLGTFRPASTSYSTMSTAAFTTTAGTHALRFVGRDSAGGNNTAFIDAVQITGTVVGIADAGTVTVSVNGAPYSTSFGAGDTSTTIASRLATTINAGSYASATASGATINLTSKTAGTIGAYSLTASYTWNSSQFTNSSFTTSTSGAALSGAYNAGDIRNNPFVTLYAYDALGNLLRVDQKGTAPSDSTQWRTRTFTYDSLSRLLTANNPESGTITYSYDADSELLQKTSPAPNQTGSATQTVSYCYDALHRVTGKGYGAQTCPLATPVVTYAYDSGTNAIGHLTSLTDQAGTASYTYDIMGRVAAETRPIAGVSKGTSYTYNLNGSVKALTYPSGRVVTYTPDSAGRAVSAADGNGTSYVTSASYNPAGSLKSLLSGSTPALNQNFQYTPRLQLCRITALTSGTLPTSCTDSQNIGNIMDRGYDFHAGNGTSGSGTDNGNVFGITNYRDTTRSQSFTYDALNRLTAGWSSANTGAYSWGENYSIDAWGNLQISPMGGKAHGGTFALSGNAQNRPTGLAYDAAGNLMSYLSATYIYDQENRLSSTAGTTYTYDGNGERVLKSNTITGAAVKRYWSTGGNTLAEGDGSGNLTAEYIYFGGKRIARIDLPANTVHYYLSDHLGSTSVVVSAAGTIEEESDYYPFGTEVIVTGPGANELKFTGKRRDAESQLDYFGARYYSNAFGRFSTADLPFADQHKQNPQTWNLYTYGRNNPLGGIDPNGRGYIDIAALVQSVKDWWNGSVARDGGAGNFAKNNGIGAAKGTGTFGLNTLRSALSTGTPVWASAGPGAMTVAPVIPTPAALTPSNQTQAQASTATQITLTVATAAIPLGGAETTATTTVTHFTSDAAVAAISESGTLNAGTWVTLPSEIPTGSSSSAVESLLEIGPGKGANSVTFETPSSNLVVPDNGPTTSGGATQFQLKEPQPINPADFKQTPK